MPDKCTSGRLEIRSEGQHWNAYFIDSNDNKVLICSIHTNAVCGDNPENKNIFLQLARNIAEDIVKAMTGEKPNWDESTCINNMNEDRFK